MDINKLFESAKNIKAPRYKTINKRKIKLEEFNSLDDFEKDELESSSLDWTEIDKELNDINKQYDQTNNPIQKRILTLKYDLRLEEFAGDEPHRLKALERDLLKLQEMLKEKK